MLATCGRGPTIDISPLSTLNSCGSSSIEVRRSSAPTGVIRGSFRVAPTEPSSLGSTVIVRNLKMWNGRPLKPIRAWRKNTGPSEVSRIASAVSAISGPATTSARLATT